MDSVDRSRDHRSSRRRSRSSKDRRRDERPDRDEEVKKGRVAEAVDRNPLDDRERDRRDRDLRKEGRSRSREGDGDRRRRRDRDSRSRERSPRRRRDDGRMLGSRERSSRHRRDEDQYRERSSDRRRSYRDSRDRRDREKTTDKDSVRDRGDDKSQQSGRSSRQASPPTRPIRPLSDQDTLRPGPGDRGRERDETRSRRSDRSSRQPSPPPSRSVRSSNPLPDQNALRPGASAEGTPAVDDEPKEKPNFNASGLLAAESNTFQGVVLKYHEPPSAAKPTKKWRLYVFKPPASAPVEILSLHAQSAFLIGRDATICDIPLLHPSISKQHAVIQFKWRERVNEYGDRRRDVVPYVIDLESANGTSVNGEVVEGARYVELMVGDLVRFGESTREYVVMCEDVVV